MASPPSFKIPAPPAKTGKGSAFQQFINYWAKRYPSLKANAPDIQAAASAAKIDPVWFAGLLLLESGADYKAKDSSAGAIGIGQLEPSSFVGQPVPWDSTRTVTLQDLRDPTTNLRLAAYYAAQKVGSLGYANAYSGQGGYNPGYTGNQVDPKGLGPQAFIQKWSGQYVPKTPSTSPQGPVGTQVPGGTAPPAQDVKDPWVIIGRNGGVKTVGGANAPRNAVRDGTGAPVKLSQFNAVGRSLDTLYMAWTGQRANPSVIANYIRNPVSDYEIQQRLADPKANPRLYRSPIWLTHAPDYDAVYKNVYGNNVKPPVAAVRYAVVHNLSQTGFQEYLRQQPNYSSSEEYKANAAAFQAGYESIYGTPDAVGQQKIDQAARQGWNQDQWMEALRADPAYAQSGEFQKNVYGLFSRLGFIPGGQTALQAPAPAAATPAPSPAATGVGANG